MPSGLRGEQRLASTDAKSTSPKVPTAWVSASLSFSCCIWQDHKNMPSHVMDASHMHQILRPIRRLWPIYQNQILKPPNKCGILKIYSKSWFTKSPYIGRIIIIIIIIITTTITINIVIICTIIILLLLIIIIIIIMILVHCLYIWTSILQHRNPDLQRLLPQTFNFLPLLFSSSSCRRILSLARRPTKEIQTSFFSLLSCRICTASTSASFSLSCCTW